MKRLFCILACFATPVIAAPDGKVDGLAPETYAVLKQMRRANPGPLTKRDAELLASAIQKDGKIVSAEHDLLEELSNPQFRSIRVAGGSASDFVSLYPTSGFARDVLKHVLSPPTDLEKEWLNEVPGWNRIVGEAKKNGESEKKVIGFIADKLEPSWKASRPENMSKPFRDAIAKLYAYSSHPSSDSVKGKSLICQASEMVDKRNKDTIPDFLYTWLRPKEVAWGCTLMKEPYR